MIERLYGPDVSAGVFVAILVVGIALFALLIVWLHGLHVRERRQMADEIRRTQEIRRREAKPAPPEPEPSVTWRKAGDPWQ